MIYQYTTASANYGAITLAKFYIGHPHPENTEPFLVITNDDNTEYCYPTQLFTEAHFRGAGVLEGINEALLVDSLNNPPPPDPTPPIERTLEEIKQMITDLKNDIINAKE